MEQIASLSRSNQQKDEEHAAALKKAEVAHYTLGPQCHALYGTMPCAVLYYAMPCTVLCHALTTMASEAGALTTMRHLQDELESARRLTPPTC